MGVGTCPGRCGILSCMVSKINALVRILINGVDGTGLMTESPLSFNKLNQGNIIILAACKCMHGQ